MTIHTELASGRQVGSSWALAVSHRWPPSPEIWVPRRPPRRRLLPPDLMVLCRAAAQALSPAPSPVDKLSQGGDISLCPHCYQAGYEKCLHGEQLCFSIQSSWKPLPVKLVRVPSRKGKAVNTFRSSSQEEHLSPQPLLLPVFYPRETMMSPFLASVAGKMSTKSCAQLEQLLLAWIPGMCVSPHHTHTHTTHSSHVFSHSHLSGSRWGHIPAGLN